ncbi:MAG: TIGR03915 family putative DNA repair protein [Oscillospiraceae bacterium]|nr:TIGR03915 family putative DNA repair protein [Oscillospiraceae bacterium]
MDNNLIYVYDGTYQGLLCCVFESFQKKEEPIRIITTQERQTSIFRTRYIETDPEKAARVSKSIPEKISKTANELVSLCFLTCLENKEKLILDFLRKGYRYKGKIVNMLTDDTVDKLTKSVRHLMKESHLIKGFVRFSVYENVLVSVIGPKNFILPLIKEHFCERYKNDIFTIYDEVHGCALVYKPYNSAIVPISEFVLDSPGTQEQNYRRLWREYYDAIAIQGRYNPKCRMSLMPKRYWDYMTEFQSETENRKLK